jgi:hypothetical protein
MCAQHDIGGDELDEDYNGSDIACTTCRKRHEFGQVLAWPTLQHKTGSKRLGYWGGRQLQDEEDM